MTRRVMAPDLAGGINDGSGAILLKNSEVARVQGCCFTLVIEAGVKPMMGERRVQQDALFYEFSLERHVPERHLLRSIDRFVELDGVRQELAPFYSETSRPSVDPELLIRMLI